MQLSRLFLRLYPARYQEWFGAEMAGLLEEVAGERRQRGCAAFARFTAVEFAGLLLGIAIEWFVYLRLGNRYLVACDEASARQSTRSRLPDDVVEAQTEIDFLVSKMVEAIAMHQFDKARFYSVEERKARANLRALHYFPSTE